MIALRFAILDARPAAQTAAPAIVFRVRIERQGEGRVHAAVLRAQVQIEARARRYANDEQGRLYELFGDPAMWDRSLGHVIWSQAPLVTPSFERDLEIDLPIACTYDLEVAAAKYLHAVRDGEVPLAFLFTGTVFAANGRGLNVEPVSWDSEASFRMPARVWRAAMDGFFPGGGWIRLRQDTIDRLQEFRAGRASLGWDDALDALLGRASAKEIA